MNPRMNPFDRDHIADIKRAEIVKVAGELFCSSGYNTITIEQIARSIGLTKTVVYYYFKSKQDIFVECHVLATDLLEKAFKESVCDDHMVQLSVFIKKYVLSLIGGQSPGAVLLDTELLPEQERRSVVARREAVYGRLRGLLENLIEQGSVQQVDAKLAVVSMMSAINIIPKWYRRDGPWTAEQVADHFSKYLTAGLTAGIK